MLSAVAGYAADTGVRLGIEPVNRYETFLLNTAEQAMDLLTRIGKANVFIHLDTYHLFLRVIEELPERAQLIGMMCSAD